MSVEIKGVSVSNVLIGLGVAINVITSDTSEALTLTHIQPTSTMLQLVDLSITKLEGILEDIIVTIDTWEYLVDFLILQTRKKHLGYPIILGRPWLATTASLIDYRLRNMTISNGKKLKELSIYPPAKPFL